MVMNETIEKKKQYTIELDCPPGAPRPGDLLPSVLEGTGVAINPQATVSRFFGNWMWQVPDSQREQYETHREEIAARIKVLYERGVIRYGSW